MLEKTLVLIKPDAMRNAHLMTIRKIYTKTGKLKEVNSRLFFRIPIAIAKALYAEHENKDFYDRNLKFITSGPVVAICLEGENAIQLVRQLNGATDPKKAEKDTIRQMFGTVLPRNAVHSSANKKAAEEELKIIFG